MISSRDLLKLYEAERPFIQQALDLAEHFAEVRKTQSEKGLDWARAKVLFKAMLQDEQDGGHRVEDITRRADTTSEYATLMNKKNFSSQTEPAVDLMAQPVSLAVDGETWPVESTWTPGPSLEADVTSDISGPEEDNGASGPTIEAAPPGGVGGADSGAAMPVAGHPIPDDLSIPEFLLR